MTTTRVRENFKHQVQEWAQRIGVRPTRVQIQPMTRKWASCSPAGRLCFSTRLLRQPAPFREMVVVHELLHLKIPNHGRLFRALLRIHLPNHQAIHAAHAPGASNAAKKK